MSYSPIAHTQHQVLIPVVNHLDAVNNVRGLVPVIRYVHLNHIYTYCTITNLLSQTKSRLYTDSGLDLVWGLVTILCHDWGKYDHVYTIHLSILLQLEICNCLESIPKSPTWLNHWSNKQSECFNVHVASPYCASTDDFRIIRRAISLRNRGKHFQFRVCCIFQHNDCIMGFMLRPIPCYLQKPSGIIRYQGITCITFWSNNHSKNNDGNHG